MTAPMIDPAMPICAESAKDVAAARPVATICEREKSPRMPALRPSFSAMCASLL